MYIPYLRGKQFELSALKSLIEEGLISSNYIMPVIEPVSNARVFASSMDYFDEVEFPVYTVINPQVGSFETFTDGHPIHDQYSCQYEAILMNNVDVPDFSQFIDSDANLIAIYKRPEDLNSYAELSRNNLNPNLHLVNHSLRYSRVINPNEQIGLLRDCFVKQDRNSDYADNEDEFFSEDHLYFSEEGYVAFSDYSTLSAEYQDGGYAPRAVAIHIVYFDNEDKLRIKHFVSDTNSDISNPAGKFSEALRKLVLWARGLEDKNQSAGLNNFIDLYNQARYPGLGIVKKLSIMHHLEIMNRYLSERA
ncbi:sce7725 family protein [Exiguobacterium sp. s155]|uniref:sce7725 family protein n=1 Tax=Exiguobacterium sp. s155 TaxID=2751286 RepID=UPI001BE8FFA8|nr:sce7725 family protein [Exiguobacterium sp. s155]